MWMRLPNAEYRRGQGAGNRRALRRLTQEFPPGLLAYEAGRPVGWVAVAPREQYRRLETSRVLAPVPAERVWSVPCFFVASEHRGRGVTRALLDAALGFARRHGARHVEGYPVVATGARQAAAFVFPGFDSTFRRAGFRELARRSRARCIMRRGVRAVAASPRGPRG
jgi:GNAT superfamily N-acetyltransferase